MKEFIGKYGWVSIDKTEEEYFQEDVYPADLNLITGSILCDYVFKCIGAFDKEYLVLKSSEVTVRLKKDIFRLMPKQPAFVPLETVKFFSSKGILTYGIVKGISWHNNKGKHIYKLEVNGKMKTHRYFEEDLDKSKWQIIED